MIEWLVLIVLLVAGVAAYETLHKEGTRNQLENKDD